MKGEFQKPSPVPAGGTAPSAAGMGRQVLVTDFDGTLTRRDFFELVLERWPTPENDARWQQFLAGRLTHFQALAGIFGSLRVPTAELEAVVGEMELDPTLGASLQRLRRAGWEVVVASAGCAWYIERLLASAGLDLVVHACPGTYDPATGLVLCAPEESPFYSPSTGIDKEAVVHWASRQAGHVAFAGDGRPDWTAALRVPARRRFARGWLAHHLHKAGHAFQPFDSWTQIADHLAGRAPA